MPLPPGKQMYYNVDPQYDDRHSRLIISSLTKDLAYFFEIYAKAKRFNDAGYFREANEARSRLEIARVTVVEQISLFSTTLHSKLSEATGRVMIALDTYPAFPQPLSRDDDGVPLQNFYHRLQARGTTSEVNAPIQRASPLAIKPAPPSEADAFRTSNIQAHSIVNAGARDRFTPLTTPKTNNRVIDDIIAAAPPVASSHPQPPPIATPSLVGTRSIASSTAHSVYESTVDPRESAVSRFVNPGSPNSTRRTSSVIMGPVVEFPSTPGMEDVGEKHFLLQKRYDDLLLEKEEWALREKEVRDRINRNLQIIREEQDDLLEYTFKDWI